jgi:mono/diheme cytochrome c family protein
MKRGIALAALALLASCQQEPRQQSAAKGPPAGPPPWPAYTMRTEVPSGNRHASGRDGQALFEVHCGYCHLPGGMATNLLTPQRMAVGEGPEMALLSNRQDLAPDYVKAVVRQGKNAMPPQTRVDITDAELDAVAAYLGKAK